MAEKTVNVKIKTKQDTATNWQTNNPVLSNGEQGWDSTNKRMKVGDGTSAWNSLDYTDSVYHADSSLMSDTEFNALWREVSSGSTAADSYFMTDTEFNTLWTKILSS